MTTGLSCGKGNYSTCTSKLRGDMFPISVTNVSGFKNFFHVSSLIHWQNTLFYFQMSLSKHVWHHALMCPDTIKILCVILHMWLLTDIWVVNWRFPFRIRNRTTALRLIAFCTQLSQANADITLQITSRPLPFTCFTVILPLDVTSPDTPRTSLNGSYMH